MTTKSYLALFPVTRYREKSSLLSLFRAPGNEAKTYLVANGNGVSIWAPADVDILSPSVHSVGGLTSYGHVMITWCHMQSK